MNMALPPRPPFDPAYKFATGIPGSPPDLQIHERRKLLNAGTAEDILAKHPNLTHTLHTAPGQQDPGHNPNLPSTQAHPPVPISIFETKASSSPSSNTNTRAAILYIHGGGQVFGNRFFGLADHLATFPLSHSLILASVEYRLAPEHRAPAATYDVYAALQYLLDNAASLRIDADRILVYAVSGGAAPAAGACLLGKRRGGVKVRAMVLSYPMLDDREEGMASSRQFESQTVWPGSVNRQAWEAVLGPDRESVTELQVPGRAQDLSGFPDVFVDVGECEVFRDSAVRFAGRVWSSGGSCELHVWPGMYHASAMMEPGVDASKRAMAAQVSFVVTKLELWRDGDGVEQEREYAML